MLLGSVRPCSLTPVRTLSCKTPQKKSPRHMVHGWECRGSPAMLLAVLVVVATRCFCFRFLLASYDLPCYLQTAILQPHTYPTVSISPWRSLPWTCTLGMHLGHAPRHHGCHVPHLVPPWGMHAAPWTLDLGPWTLGLGPWTLDLGVQRLDPRTPSDPHCLELPARKGKGAVGWAGLWGRAGTSKSVGPTQGSTTTAGWQSRDPSAATPGGACPGPIAWPFPTGSPHAA